MKTRLFVFVAVGLLVASLSARAQEPQGNVYAVSTFKVPFDQVSEYSDLYEKETKPRTAQNEFIVSQKIFTHLYGPDWTILVITEYKDLASIQAAQKRGTELFEKQYPEKAKRDELAKKFQSFFRGHTDALVVENPKLRK